MDNTIICGASLLTPLGNTPTLVKGMIRAGINTYRTSSLLGDDEPDILVSSIPDGALLGNL
jgi:hypothetical protein